MTIPEHLITFTEPMTVLDKGFVRLVDVMGDDTAIVQAARVSYGEGTKSVQDDRNLIRYLIRNQHTSPFEMCEIKLHVKVPMDCWRQWVRHRTANINEYSTRYSVAIDDTQQTSPDNWRLQSNVNKQGSGECLSPEDGIKFSRQESMLNLFTKQVYKDRLKQGIAREQARKDLPLSTYTEAYWKVDLHNLLHFLRLRLDTHAQEEIRKYAEAIASIVEAWVPYTWEAFTDYRLKSMELSRLEIDLLKSLILKERPSVTLGKREVKEFQAKLERLGIYYEP